MARDHWRELTEQPRARTILPYLPSTPGAPALPSTTEKKRSAREVPKREPTPRAEPAAAPAPKTPEPAAVPPLLAPRALDSGPSVMLGTTTKGQPVRWYPAAEQNAFVLLCGASGSGKTEALRLFSSDLNRSRVPVVVLDVRGDLALPGLETIDLGVRLGVNPLQLPSVEPAAGGPVRHAGALVDAIRSAAPRLGDSQAYTLKTALLEAYKAAGFTADPSTWRKPAPTLHDVLKLLKKHVQCGGKPAGNASMMGLLAALDSLFGDAVFNQPQALPVSRLESGGLRLNLSDLPDAVQVLVIDTLVRQRYSALRSRGPVAGGVVRSFVVCDEAAQLTRSPVLPHVFREARKYGLGMAIASQLADDFGAVLRGNAGTLVVLRSTSSAEVRKNARELDVSEAQLRELDRPGAAIVRTQAGTQRVQLRRAQGGG